MGGGVVLVDAPRQNSCERRNLTILRAGLSAKNAIHHCLATKMEQAAGTLGESQNMRPIPILQPGSLNEVASYISRRSKGQIQLGSF